MISPQLTISSQDIEGFEGFEVRDDIGDIYFLTTMDHGDEFIMSVADADTGSLIAPPSWNNGYPNRHEAARAARKRR